MCFIIELLTITTFAFANQSGSYEPDPANFPFELAPGACLHPGADELAAILDIGRAGVAQVDQEIAVHLRDLGVAEFQPAATRLFDQLPGLLPRWFLEGRSA